MRQDQIVNIIGVDTDTVDTEVKPGFSRYNLNCTIASPDNGYTGAVESTDGNTLIAFNLPIGVSEVKGQFEDKKDRSIIYLVKNSLGNHFIARYWHDRGTTGEIELIFQDSILDFSDSKITGIALKDNMLYWTDGEKPQRKLNLVKANLNDKKLKGNIYFGTDTDKVFTAGTTYRFDFIRNGAITLENIITLNGTQAESLFSVVESFVANFNNNANVNTFFTATSKGTYVEIEQIAVDPLVTSISIFASPTPSWFVYQNIYPKPYIEDFIQLAKYPPVFPVLGEYKTDEKRIQNFIQSKTFQFRLRYVYDDFEKSILSPISKLFYTSDEAVNYIEIDFNNARLGTLATSIIRRVEVMVRNGNKGDWRIAASLDQWEYLPGIYRFYNDGVYNTIDKREADKPTEAIPLKSKSLEIVKDRLYLGGNTEGFDPIDINAKIDMDFAEPIEQKTWTIRGTVRIHNKVYGDEIGMDWIATRQPIHNYGQGIVFGGIGVGGLLIDHWEDDLHGGDARYDQRIPEGGFIVYLAGTPYYGISRQVWDEFEAAGGGGCASGTKTVEKASNDPIIYDSSEKGYAPPLGYCKIKMKFRSAIRELMEQGRTYTDFEIKGVLPGTYIMRVASHWCSAGDTLGKGPMYDLNNGIEWQNTSTNILGVGGTSGVTEYIITLGEEGGVYDMKALLPNEGEIIVEDLSYPTMDLMDLNRASSFSGYLIDSNVSSSPNDMKQGVRMERQKIQIFTYGIPTDSMFTDHNGFFYRTTKFLIPDITTITSRFTTIDAGTGTPLVIKETNQPKFKGGLKELALGTLNTDDYDNDFHSDYHHYEYIAINHNGNVQTDARTRIEGTVVDQDGRGRKDILVVMEHVGRTDRTDSDGNFSILVYGDAVRGLNDVNGQLILSGPYFRDIITAGATSQVLFVSPFTPGGNYSDGFPFEVPDLELNITPGVGTQVHKRGGLYSWALVYFDDAMRPTAAYTSDQITKSIPYFTQDLNEVDPVKWPTPGTFEYGQPLLTWYIAHRPHPKARYYAWCRTQDMAHNLKLTWAIDDVKYVSRVDNSGTPTEVDYGSGLAKFIYLSVANFVNYKNENAELAFQTDEEIKIGYTFSKGDRLRIQRDSTGNYFDEYIDVPIKDMDGFDIVIEDIEDLPELHPGTVIEVYNPELKIDQKLYYEIGEIYEILLPFTSFAYHTVVSDVFSGGDTYIIKRVISVNGESGRASLTFTMESSSVSDFYDSEDSDIGRPNIEDKDQRERLYMGGVRFSDIYQSETQINGFSSFEPGNNILLPSEFGLIHKLIRSNIINREVLLAITESEAISLYIGEAQIQDLAGQRLLAISSSVIGAVSVLDGGYGTAHPESVVEHKGRVWWFSVYKARFVRYSADGITDLVENKDNPNDNHVISYFNNKSEEILKSSSAAVVTGYDPRKDELNVTFHSTRINEGVEEGVAETFAYNTKLREWTTFYSYTPEMYSKVAQRCIAFKSGQLWVQNTNALQNNFFGVQYLQRVQPVFNQANKSTKIWQAMSYKSIGGKWDCIEITTPKNDYNPNGQVSELLVDDFTDLEGVFWASFFRDKNSPNFASQFEALINGEELRSETITILMQNGSTNKVVLYNIYTDALLSELTKK